LVEVDAGLPQLTFERLQLDGPGFVQLVERVMAVLLRHNPEWETPKPLSEQELLLLARHVFETWHTLTPPARDMEAPPAALSEVAVDGPAAQAVALALAASLMHAADEILPQLDLSRWQNEYCPICGGWPNLALLQDKTGARRLLCSRCDSTWGYSRIGCPYCRSQEKQTYYLGDDQVYRLYVCPDCERYLKTVDLREVYRDVHPVLERLLAVRMDLAAQEAGFKG
jgi:hypothetical protein